MVARGECGRPPLRHADGAVGPGLQQRARLPMPGVGGLQLPDLHPHLVVPGFQHLAGRGGWRGPPPALPAGGIGGGGELDLILRNGGRSWHRGWERGRSRPRPRPSLDLTVHAACRCAMVGWNPVLFALSSGSAGAALTPGTPPLLSGPAHLKRTCTTTAPARAHACAPRTRAQDSPGAELGRPDGGGTRGDALLEPGRPALGAL